MQIAPHTQFYVFDEAAAPLDMTRRDPQGWKEKHDRILAAALKEFIASGFEGASMDRIAERAGVSKVTVYNHFDGKTELFDAVLANCAIKVEHDFGSFEAGDLESELRRFCTSVLTLVQRPETVGVTRLMAVEAFRQRTDKRATPLQMDFGSGQLSAFLSSHAHSGRLVLPNGPKLAARQLIGMLLENCFSPMFWGVDGESSQECGAEMVDSSVKMFLGHYRP